MNSGQGQASLRRAIKLRHAVALYVSSVLGSGILLLPGLAAIVAGPGSLLALGTPLCGKCSVCVYICLPFV